ncbi:hypothetical protein ACFW6F_31790 [Streptomyces sp. NPDC058746]|uniref:hypothetical protein n=1 Tax=Streptomyces sp. NPDC058746 TaxID=3346622 RepID=UPI0036863739
MGSVPVPGRPPDVEVVQGGERPIGVSWRVSVTQDVETAAAGPGGAVEKVCPRQDSNLRPSA